MADTPMATANSPATTSIILTVISVYNDRDPPLMVVQWPRVIGGLDVADAILAAAAVLIPDAM